MGNLVAELIAATLLRDRRVVSQKAKTEVPLTALSAFLFCLGVLFTIISVERFFSTLYRPDMAMALTALVSFILALGIYLVLRERSETKTRNTDMGKSDNQNDIGRFLDDFLGDIKSPVAQHPKAIVLAAALAGFFALRNRR